MEGKLDSFTFQVVAMLFVFALALAIIILKEGYSIFFTKDEYYSVTWFIIKCAYFLIVLIYFFSLTLEGVV